MFDYLVWATIAVSLLGAALAYARNRDTFHPLMFFSPMFIFFYGWVPLQLQGADRLSIYADQDLVFVAAVYLLGVSAFVIGCLSVSCPPAQRRLRFHGFSGRPAQIIQKAALVLGTIGMGAWLVTMWDAGMIFTSYSQGAATGMAKSGYILDSVFLLIPASILIMMTTATSALGDFGRRALLVVFAAPWVHQGLFGARRGPTFMIFVGLGMGWFLIRGHRPSLKALGAGLAGVGVLMLLLVANRSQILSYESGFELKETNPAEAAMGSAGGDYVYGIGSMLSFELTGNHYWGKRYLAQILVRPIPRQLWPTKYADFGVPQLEHNAGTAGDGFRYTLGWDEAPGSAPGIVADLWIEFWWMAIPAMGVLGWFYAFVWKRATTRGGMWNLQHVIVMILSVYLVMQTMEAIIFRVLVLSLPPWILWKWSNATTKVRPIARNRQCESSDAGLSVAAPRGL